jgi:hypothetical protein
MIRKIDVLRTAGIAPFTSRFLKICTGGQNRQAHISKPLINLMHLSSQAQNRAEERSGLASGLRA